MEDHLFQDIIIFQKLYFQKYNNDGILRKHI